MNITISPIGSSVKTNKGLLNYNEQLNRTSSLIDGDQFWCWDDSRYNNSVAGELFAFYFPKAKNCTGNVIIHKINAVKSPEHRLPSWSANVGQTDRNILELSAPIKMYTMDEWVQLDGPMSRMGTYQTDLSSRKMLYDSINICLRSLEQYQNIPNDQEFVINVILEDTYDVCVKEV
jgi:hypothetical protein